MTNHTPGPWQASKSLSPDNTGGYDFAIADADRKIIAEVFEHVDYGTDTKYLTFPAKANACLISAAPDLLAACEGVANGLRKTEGCQVPNFLQAAIDKATR